MKRIVILTMVIGLIFGSIATAEAGKKKKKSAGPAKVERTVEYTYSAPSPGISGVVGACLTGLGVENTACQETMLAADEVFVTITVTDSTGRPTNFTLAQDTDPSDASYEIGFSGCGAAEDVPVTGGLNLRIQVNAIGGPSCPSVGTTGKVSAVLSNLP